MLRKRLGNICATSFSCAGPMLRKHFARWTPGNAMKWNEYEKEEGVYDWSRIDYIYAKAKECGENSEENISECTSTQLVAPEGTRYGAGVCGHALFWHTNQGEPGWAFKDKEGFLSSTQL